MAWGPLGGCDATSMILSVVGATIRRNDECAASEVWQPRGTTAGTGMEAINAGERVLNAGGRFKIAP